MAVLKGEKKSGRFRDFLSRNRYVLLSLFIPIAIMGIIFAIRGFYPVGRRMVMVTDCWHQYYPFLVEYQRMLKEGASVFYSWNTGGGANFIGIIANYLGSPLYLLSYFLPSSTPWLAVFFAFTIVLRIGLAGMFFSIFLRKVFRRNDISLVTFSLMYAFCAHIMGYYWNAMWLDTVALLPLVIAGVVGVLRDKEFSLYIVALTLSVACSFYIGYMVCLFVLIFSVCYTIVSFVSIRESLKNAGKMLLYTVVAFMITAIITFPAYMALQASDSASALDKFPKEFEINPGFDYEGNNPILYSFVAAARTITNLLAYNHPLKMDKGAPNIACSVLALVLLFVYFASKKIPVKERIVSGALCLFMVMSCVINQLNYIWHGMAKPAMVYYRFSFIFSFILIVMAYRAYTFVGEVGKKRFIAICGLLVVYLIAAMFLQEQISVYVTLGIAVLIVVIGLLMRFNVISEKVFALLICAVVIAESFLTAYIGVATVGSTKIANYPKAYNDVQSLKDKYISEDEMYRVEFTKYYTLNDNDLHSNFGITTFNSMVNSTYTDFMAEFGMAASVANNRYAYFETSPVFNLFFNVKYLLARDGEKSVDTGFMEEIGREGNTTLYQNNACLPMGFMVSKDVLKTELHEDWVVPLEIQNEFFSRATGIEEKVFELVPIGGKFGGKYVEKIARYQGYDCYYSVPFDSVKDNSGEVTITAEYIVPEDGSYYGVFRNSKTKTVSVIINNNREDARELDTSFTVVSAVGEYKKGDKITVEIPTKTGEKSSMAAYLYRVNEDVFRKGMEKLSESTLEITEKNSTGFKGKINVKESGLFYTSVLYDEGFKAFVDGEEVEITPVAGTLVAFELSEGEHTIELRFVPKGIYTGLTISAVGIVIFALMIVVSRKGKKQSVNETVSVGVLEGTQPESEDTDTPFLS